MVKTFEFGQYTIRSSEVFYLSKWTLGLPIVPGHVLLVPRRRVERMHDMTAEEAADLMTSAQRVGRVVEREYQGSALTVAMQDGKDAGQSVYHVHMHLIPRRKGDWANNDDIYPELDKSEAGLDADTAARSAANTSTTTPTPHGAPATTKRTGGVDFDERKERTLDDMAAEAQRLRVFFKDVNEASGLE